MDMKSMRSHKYSFLGAEIILCPFGAPRTFKVRGTFHYTTSQQFCQAKVDRQNAQRFSHNLVQNYYLIFYKKKTIMYLQGKERVLKVGEENSSANGTLRKVVDLARLVRENPLQTISKKFKKTIDN